jgi:hypothetical protein
MTHEPYICVTSDATYIACRCGWGHVVGEEDFMGHLADEYEQVPEPVARRAGSRIRVDESSQDDVYPSGLAS